MYWREENPAKEIKVSNMNEQPKGYLSDEEFEFIEAMLDKYGLDDAVLDASELDGFLTAVVSGPDMIPPSVWMPAIWGGETHSPNWESEDEFKRFISLVIRHMNCIVDMLMTKNTGEFSALFKASTQSKQQVLIVEEWCFGYMRGVDLGNWPEMSKEPEQALALIALHGKEEHFDKIEALSLKEHQSHVPLIELGAEMIHAYWLNQRQHLHPSAMAKSTVQSPVVSLPKIGRNEPCPCGSGKKYKQCCLH